MKTVWILGAGFTRPLGGPLLCDFFGQRMQEHVRAWMHVNGIELDNASCTGAYLLQALFRSGIEDGTWLNAEQFLGDVISAPTSPMQAELLLARARKIGTLRIGTANCSWDSVAADELAIWAPHYVGAAISSFVVPTLSEHINEVPEDWASYCAWFDGLDDHHTVLSFNYDRVLELLLDRHRRCSHAAPPAIRYLHGVLPTPEDVAELIRKGDPLSGLGFPGRSKKSLIVSSFAKSWIDAGDALRQADQIIIVGYSMPRTDAHTSMWLQSTLAKRAATSIKLVMGLRTENPDIARLDRVLSSPSRVSVVSSDLYTEEMLTKSVATGRFEMF